MDTRPVRTMALVFGDNDFGYTFRNLLESIYRAFEFNNGLSREALTRAVQSGIEFHYIAFQHGPHLGEKGYGRVEDTVRYLNGVKILFDEEAEADISLKDHDHGAWYLEMATGQVYAY